MLDYGSGSSWIDEIGETECPSMLEDGGGFMFRLSPRLDAYSRQAVLQSLQSVIAAEMKSPGSQHDILRQAVSGCNLVQVAPRQDRRRADND
jgi:hypothetical protein